LGDEEAPKVDAIAGREVQWIRLTHADVFQGGLKPAPPSNPSNPTSPSNPTNPTNPSNLSLPWTLSTLVEWRVVWLSITLSMVAFGYGGLTSFSALFADDLGVTPRSLFLSGMAATILIGRVSLGHMLDDLGHRRVFLTVMGAPALGLLALSVAQGRLSMLAAGLIFGAGFGLMYPAYAAYVMRHVAANRRGAAFGAIIAAFDTGVGTGSSAMGALIHRFGFRAGFATAAGIAALALPYFLFAEGRLGYKKDS
jgi:predicted MFS family arabinose efflux permease